MIATDRAITTAPVWDPLIRIFHWSLVLCFLIVQVTAEEFETIHEYTGYSILGLIMLRMVWGFIGPQHARFGSFWPTPAKLKAHLSQLIRGQHSPASGHNPAGGLMVFALLGTLLLTGASGYLNQSDLFWGTEWVEEIHEFLGEATLILVGVHVIAVILMSLVERRNLIRAMITGHYRARTIE